MTKPAVLPEKRGPFAPTVLIVDDDRLVTRRWRREFLTATSLGVVVANSLSDAAEIVEHREVQIDAVVSDLIFDYGTDDKKRRLNNGVDLLAWLQEKKIEVPMFVISATDNMVDFRLKLEEKSVRVEEFFDKFSAAEGDPAWMRIQRSVLRRKFGPDSDISLTLERTLGQDGRPAFELVSEAMSRLQLSVRTYIQDMPADSGLRVIKPIEAICVAQDGGIKAFSPGLGLLTNVLGDTVNEALEDLTDSIALEAKGLLAQNDLSDYAARVVERLRAYVVAKE